MELKNAQDCLANFQKVQGDNHDYRELSRQDDHFCLDKDGQWQDSVVNAMGNRPRFTFDKVNPLIEDMMSEVEGMDFGIRVRPSGGGATKELAETYSGIIRYIENLSNASQCYRNVTRRIMRRGVDFIRLKTDWANQDSFDQDIFIKEIKNSVDRCWLGYHEEQDGSDAEEGWMVHAMPPEEFEEKYGRKCQSIGIDDDNADQRYENKPELALYLEYLYKKEYKKTLALMSNGEVLELTDETKSVLDEMAAQGITVERQRSFTSYKVFSRFLDAQDWLDKPKETVWDSIPIIPFYGNFEIIENKLTWSGAVRRLMDYQRVYNYAKSREIEEGALAPKEVLAMTFKQASNKTTQGQLKKLNTNPDPALLYTADQEAPPPFKILGPQINQSLSAIGMSMEQGIQTTAGVFSAQQGANPRYQSGFAIEQMISKGDAKTTRWLNNTAVGVRRIAMMIIRAIPKVYDSKRQLRILNDDGTDEIIYINREELDVQTGKMVVINDLSVGQYDVVVDLDEAYKSRRQEAADRLIQLAGADPSLMIEAADIVYDALDVPGADQIKERKRLAMLKAGLIPDTQMTDEEKQMADELIKQQQQQAAQMQQQQAPVTQAMIANYESIIQERLQQMENERIKLAQAQEKIDADKQKQLDDVMLKLTQMEQEFNRQLNADAAQNREVTQNGMQ